MTGSTTHQRRGAIVLGDGIPRTVTLEIDEHAVLQLLGRRAARNGSQQASLLNGLIRARVERIPFREVP